MEKNKIIIVEGPQGTGKTTLTDYLRTVMAGSNLYRLSGQKNKTMSGKEKSRFMYESLLEYMKKMESISMDLIFDRTFFSEEVYARLGYKEYSFTDVYQALVEKLCALDYDIYFIVLYLENVMLYRQRLARDMHHNYQAFSVENSINQQKCYLEIAHELENTKINVYPIAMDDFEEAYEKINATLKLEIPRKLK